MSWKHTYMGLQTDFSKQERPGSPGRSAIFSPKGALTHHPLCRRWYGLRPPCALRGGCGPCGGLPGMTTVIPGAYGTVRYAALFHTPAKTCQWQVFAVYGGRRTRDGRRKTEVIETGNLSFGGKSYQSGNRPVRCCGSGLYELLPNLQRLRWGAA